MAKIRAGLCSVTLRAHTIDAVVDIASKAGLSSVEWGGDVHCPPGDLRTAREARILTEAAGLTVASYGSYFDGASDGDGEAAAVVDTAVAMGAPRIRVWAGHARQMADAPPIDAVVRNTNTLSSLAAKQGISIAFEFHEGTMTGSALLAKEVLARCPNGVGVYWQPFSVPARPDSESLVALRELGDHVRALHVFYYRDARQMTLAEGNRLWVDALRIASELRSPVIDALLEFVPGSSAAAVLREANILRAFISDAHPR
jgi:3-dehydroshikimate dehydratase